MSLIYGAELLPPSKLKHKNAQTQPGHMKLGCCSMETTMQIGNTNIANYFLYNQLQMKTRNESRGFKKKKHLPSYLRENYLHKAVRASTEQTVVLLYVFQYLTSFHLVPLPLRRRGKYQ